MDINAAVGGARGLTREMIDAALETRRPDEVNLSERHRLVLDYATAVTSAPVAVSDELFGRLRAAFSEREIVELTATVAHESMNSKFNRALRIESNGFCHDLTLPPDSG